MCVSTHVCACECLGALCNEIMYEGVLGETMYVCVFTYVSMCVCERFGAMLFEMVYDVCRRDRVCMCL
jgi:hypothetical protein